MVSVVAVMSPGYIGEGLVMWSIEYLSGKNFLFDPALDIAIPIPDNPLTTMNCHNFHKTRLRGTEELFAGIDYYRTKNEIVHVFYADNTYEASNICLNKEVKIVALEYSPTDYVYSNIVDRSGILPGGVIPGTEYEAILQKHYYKNESLLDLSPQEQRERLALGINYMKADYSFSRIDKYRTHYRISTDDLWNDFDTVVVNLMNHLSIKITEERWDQWMEIYKQWRKFHIPHKKFSRDLDKIINAIINNEYLDLSIYNINFFKEVVILNRLIFKHNKSLKLVERFPKNTKEFSEILEDLQYDIIVDPGNI